MAMDVDIVRMDLKKHKNEGYTSNSIIGRSGIEATYEKELRGEVGGKIVIVDENNNVIKTVAQKEAKDGKLSGKIQRFIGVRGPELSFYETQGI